MEALNLSAERVVINEIDAQLIPLLIRRQEVVKAIGEKKKAAGVPVRDPEREKAQMLKFATMCVQFGKEEAIPYILTSLRFVIDNSVRLQESSDPEGKKSSTLDNRLKTYICTTCNFNTMGTTDNKHKIPACVICGEILTRIKPEPSAQQCE